MDKEYIAANSHFLTQDTRAKRWAVPYTYETVNVRAKILLDNNKKYIKNKRVLDLGCHFGTFAYIALQLGAGFVQGVDIEPVLLEQACEYFSVYKVNKSKYDFKVGNIIEYLETLPEKSFDTVLCFGLMYYIPDNYHLLSLLKKIAKKAIILDTFTAYYCAVQGKDSKAVLKSVTADTFKLPLMLHNLTQTEKSSYALPGTVTKGNKQLSLLSCPTITLLETYFKSLGFNYSGISWDKYLENPGLNWRVLSTNQGKKESHWTDVYSSEIRVSYLLEV
ncbi:MAG: class I SAM-dependent methyltransferase [Candidatus Margulisbacteria bacterium]|nr:class I SAM-dependent methyltransferase [Candidatus Margulisiibacteriota bacterium]